MYDDNQNMISDRKKKKMCHHHPDYRLSCSLIWVGGGVEVVMKRPFTIHFQLFKGAKLICECARSENSGEIFEVASWAK